MQDGQLSVLHRRLLFCHGQYPTGNEGHDQRGGSIPPSGHVIVGQMFSDSGRFPARVDVCWLTALLLRRLGVSPTAWPISRGSRRTTACWTSASTSCAAAARGHLSMTNTGSTSGRMDHKLVASPLNVHTHQKGRHRRLDAVNTPASPSVSLRAAMPRTTIPRRGCPPASSFPKVCMPCPTRLLSPTAATSASWTA